MQTIKNVTSVSYNSDQAKTSLDSVRDNVTFESLLHQKTDTTEPYETIILEASLLNM